MRGPSGRRLFVVRPSVDVVAFQFLVEGAHADAETFGGETSVSPHLVQCFPDRVTFDVAHGACRLGYAAAPLMEREVLAANRVTIGEDGRALECVHELADVAGPGRGTDACERSAVQSQG